MRFRVIILPLVLLLAGSSLRPVAAQLSENELSTLFQQGRSAFDRGEANVAMEAFTRVFEQNPAWSEVKYGGVAYWLSGAQRAVGQDSLASVTLTRGVDAMQEQGSFDVRLANAFLMDRLSSPAGPSQSIVLDQYVNLLYNVDALLDDTERRILGQHIAQFALVAPAGVLQDAFRGDPAAGEESWEARSGAGPLLVAWWRSQDPVPATRSNERLEEHLRRVGTALAEYPAPDSPSGLDLRGETFLRYGPPEEQIKVRFDDPVLTDIIFRPGATVNLSDFPENEFWVFGHIDRAAWFLFIREKGEWRIGETIDLIPTNLRSGFSASQRGRIKAGMSIAVMQNIFRQLSPLHPDFAMRYAEVDNYAMQMPEFATGRLTNRVSGSLGATPAPVTGGTQIAQPSQFIQGMMVKSRSEDDVSIATRDKVAPRVYTEALAEEGVLEVGYRAVRYLEPDGSTRTVVHWSPEPGGIRPGPKERRLMESMSYDDSGRYLVTLTAVQKDATYIDRVIHRDRFLITELPDGPEAIPVQQTTIAGDTALYNLAFQWDQYAMGASRTRRGPRLRVATARLDSLSALNADPKSLEMSDLLPMTALLDVAPVDFTPTPYPFAVLTRDLQLALSFEIYHLAYGADDQTRYSVAFEVQKDVRRGGFLALRGGRGEGTSARFTSTGTTRKANQMILIDLQAWEGSGEMNITVTVTDEITGQTSSRDITFELR